MAKSILNLELTADEKFMLKQKKVTQKALAGLAINEIIEVLQSSPQRRITLSALYEFQSLPSIGLQFAKDLIFLNYYSLAQLKGKDGAELLDAYEIKRGCRVDTCVEDQFRLVVHYANNPESKKQWWDFTAERKAYRSENGYLVNMVK